MVVYANGIYKGDFCVVWRTVVWMDGLELELVCLVGRYTVYCVQDSPQLFGYCVFRWGEEKEYEEFRCKCWSYTSTVPTDPRFITMPGRRAMGLSFFKGGALPIWEGRYLLTDPRKVGAVTSNGRKTTKLEDVRINACPVPSRAIPRLVAVKSFLPRPKPCTWILTLIFSLAVRTRSNLSPLNAHHLFADTDRNSPIIHTFHLASIASDVSHEPSVRLTDVSSSTYTHSTRAQPLSKLCLTWTYLTKGIFTILEHIPSIVAYGSSTH